MKKERYVTKTYISGVNGYIRKPEEQSVFYVNEVLDLSRMIVDMEGNIRHFPGVEENEVLMEELGRWSITPVARYTVRFEEAPNEQIRMIWTVRPDGRFFMDEDGFGDEGFEQVCLYTHIDANGDYIAPFRLYSIGNKNYFTES